MVQPSSDWPVCLGRRRLEGGVGKMASVIYSLVVVSVCLVSSAVGAHWDHSVFLDDDYRLLWSISGYDITFEVQARTHGYIGLGFSKDGTIYGADIVIGWVHQGQVHFQVSPSKISIVLNCKYVVQVKRNL